MNISDFRFIVCPYCSRSVKPHTILLRKNKRIIYGIAQCGCDQYPIIDEILILKKPVNREVLNDLRGHRFIQARNHLMDIRFGYNRFLKMLASGTVLDRIYRFAVSRPLMNDVGYQGVLLPLTLFPQSREWGRYLMRLPTAPESRIPQWIIAHTKRAETVIDVGCGVTPYAVRGAIKRVPSLIGIDTNFALLFLSKTFFRNAHQSLICSDLSHGFPIRPGVADFTFSLNCFTYLYSQKRTLHAMMRSLKPGGMVFIGDLHVSVDKSWIYWYPRPPSFYTAKSPMHHAVIDYDALLARVSTNPCVRMGALPFTRTKVGRYGILFGPLDT